MPKRYVKECWTKGWIYDVTPNALLILSAPDEFKPISLAYHPSMAWEVEKLLSLKDNIRWYGIEWIELYDNPQCQGTPYSRLYVGSVPFSEDDNIEAEVEKAGASSTWNLEDYYRMFDVSNDYDPSDYG